MSGPALELAAIVLNMTVGAFDAGLFDEAAAAQRSSGGAAGAGGARGRDAGGRRGRPHRGRCEPGVRRPRLRENGGPSSATFADALKRVPYVVSLNDRLDETSLLADVLAPASHPFECWSDAALPKGLFAIQQPVIQPLFDTRGLLDVLVEWGAAAGDPAALAAVTAAAEAAKTTPLPATAVPAPSPSAAFHYLRAAWAGRMAADPAAPAFDAAWNEVLRKGSDSAASVESPPRVDTAATRLAPAPGAQKTSPAQALGSPAPGTTPRSARAIAPAAFALLAEAAVPPAEIELQLYPHLALGDGRSGNNGWLHEVPDPITRSPGAARSRLRRGGSTR